MVIEFRNRKTTTLAVEIVQLHLKTRLHSPSLLRTIQRGITTTCRIARSMNGSMMRRVARQRQTTLIFRFSTLIVMSNRQVREPFTNGITILQSNHIARIDSVTSRITCQISRSSRNSRNVRDFKLILSR